MVSNRKRVVVTGMGAVTPLGQTVPEFWEALVRGQSGIGPITLCDASPFPCRIAGEVTDFDPVQYMDAKDARRMARFSQLSVAAASLAIEDADLGLDDRDRERMGVVMGNGNGGFPTTEENARILVSKGGMRMSPFFIPMILPNMAAANVSRIFGLKGYTSTIITACAAGNQAIGEAAEAVRRGAADVILAGGCEAGISQLGLGGFNVIKALSRQNDEPEKSQPPVRCQTRRLRSGGGGGRSCRGAHRARARSRRHDTGGGARPGGVLGRVPRGPAGRGRERGGARDSLGARRLRHRPRRGGLHQRSRHVHPQERPVPRRWRSRRRSETGPTRCPSAPRSL